MNTIQNNILTAILITTMSLCFTTTAQNADREEIQRQTERLRQPLGVKNDAEWAILSERIAKVIELRNAGGGRGGNRDDRARGGRQRDQGAGDRTQRNRGQGNRDRAEGNRGERERRESDRTRSGQNRRERDQANRGQGNRGESDRNQGDRNRNGRERNFDPNSQQGKLQSALERNASESEMNRLLKAYRVERESNARKLEQARAALREIVTVRQEVVLVLNRLLD